MAKASPFATFLIIGTTCFFLGILFASFPYDYFVIWSIPTQGNVPPPYPIPPPDRPIEATRLPFFDMLEHHLRVMHDAPPLISRILHTVIGTGLLGIMMKLYKPSEANMLFDGATLVLYMVGIAVYITNIVKGMRVVTLGVYGAVPEDFAKAGKYLENQKEAIREAAEAAKNDIPENMTVLGREDSLKVLAASNTILALVLVGVLVLQAGQWYAQRREDAELAEMDRAAQAKKKGGSATAATPSEKNEGEKKKQ